MNGDLDDIDVGFEFEQSPQIALERSPHTHWLEEETIPSTRKERNEERNEFTREEQNSSRVPRATKIGNTKRKLIM